MADTTPFVLTDIFFDGVRTDLNLTQAEIDLINGSNLLISLLHEFDNGIRKLLYNPVSNFYDQDPLGDHHVYISRTGTNFVRLLGHELSHFYDQVKKQDLTTEWTNFDHIIANDMDEAQATAMSFIIRQQILASTGTDGTDGTDIEISNRIGRFLPDGTVTQAGQDAELQAGQDAELAHLQTTFGGRVTSTMSTDDCWALATEIANDIWGKNFLTRPRGGTNRWEDRLEETYEDNGKDIPIFLQSSERTFQSAELQQDGTHKFIFTDQNGGGDRTWVYEATTGTAGNDLVTGTEADNNDTLSGGAGDDILYGGWQNSDLGNDTLSGDAGNDTLIGGVGQDTMDGGADNDTFIIEGTDTAYDIFQGGTGTDTIKGADTAGNENDTIRVNQFTNHGIEAIDGGAGENVIAGTDGNDTIDLTGVTVTNIDRIEGGAGQDTITGTSGNDTLYGGSKGAVDDNAVKGSGLTYGCFQVK